MSFPFVQPGASSTGDYYGRGLGHIARSGRLWDVADFALARDPEVYERLRRDPIIAFALRLRKLLSSGTDWYLESASTSDGDRQLVKIFEELLKQINYFSMARFNLAEAVIAGSRWAKIEGEAIELEIEGVENTKWNVVKRMADIDKRRFRQVPVDHPPIEREVRYTVPGVEVPVGETAPDKAVPMFEVQREWVWQIYRPLQQIWENIDRDEFVRHVFDDREDSLGYGSGIASELYTYWFAKEIALQHGLQYLERWAQGMILVKVDTLRDGQASAPAASQRMTDWLNVIDKMRSRHAIVADAKDDIKLIDAPNNGWTSALDCIDYLDGAMRVLILGASLPTTRDASGGSYAMAEIQQSVTDTMCRFDRTAQEESLRRDLLGWLWRNNYKAIRELGLEKCAIPFIRIREDRKDDHQIRADVLIKARQAGLEIRKDEAYAQLGFSLPAKGDEILAPLGMQESFNQGGDGGIGADEEALGSPSDKSDNVDQNKRDAKKKAAEDSKDSVRNKIRPDNKAGPSKGLREKVIDSQTSGFSAMQPINYLPATPDTFAIKRDPVQNERFEAATKLMSQYMDSFSGYTAPTINVMVPQQAAPIVNVSPANVTLKPIVTVVPEVNVKIPKQDVVVNIDSPIVNVEMPKPQPREIKFNKGRDGTIESAEITSN